MQRICPEMISVGPGQSEMVKLTGIASHTLGSVPWSLNVPQPERAYSVNKNDRLLSIMMVIWSVAISSDSLVYFEEKVSTHFRESCEAHSLGSASPTHSRR
jgi:hypothetical protein